MLKNSIEKVWNKESENVNCINEAIELLDSGKLRIAEKIDGKWVVNDYLKKAILLFFRFNKSEIMEGGSCPFFDKVPLKTENWREEDFVRAGFRSVPGSLIRKGAHIEKSVVLMPCFINIGAYIGESTMIDSNALVGSCAQIGKNCHISDGVTIGGVLEPLQANPVIIEDNCFIGARSVITEGVIVGEGSVIGAGVVLSASTKIIDRETGAVSFGYIPPYSVVVAGTYSTDNGLSLCCAVVVKKVTAETRKKTAINELLRQ
ncbi:MAG: 2,3,4,5-tetrahydropyridine-2,6-dicarboxylate N-succinyltransferase [Alphaproteobacteria bacterium]|nr:2,3,4,5-tetrahydropyridine-2,6-dicarboxylate N-succinyltransferase [Alphaproteobacteria bacterium]